jgi:hypothetical protein
VSGRPGSADAAGRPRPSPCRECRCTPLWPGLTCPWSITCPRCRAAPGQRCRRPSGHDAAMHAERYLLAERMDAKAGFSYPGQGVRGPGGFVKEQREREERWP